MKYSERESLALYENLFQSLESHLAAMVNLSAESISSLFDLMRPNFEGIFLQFDLDHPGMLKKLGIDTGRLDRAMQALGAAKDSAAKQKIIPELLEVTRQMRTSFSQSQEDDGPVVDRGNLGGSHSFGGVRDRFEDDPKRGFGSGREFFQAVMRAYTGGVIGDNLRSLAAGSDEHGNYSDPNGGFLVPTAFLPDLKTTEFDDVIGGRTQAVNMPSPEVHIPARVDKDHSTSVSGGLRVYRRAETQAISPSRMQTELIVLRATSLMGLSFASEEILQDSAFGLAQLLERGFRSEFGSRLQHERISGTGVGEFLGILNSGAKIAVDPDNGQPADSITYTNLVNMRLRCYGYGNAIWLYNQDCLARLMTMVNPAGQFIWQNSARDGEPDRLLGRPAFACEDCNVLGDEGDLILANWAEYLEGTYQPVEGAESMHVRFENHERAFKFFMRNAGSPWWRSVMTPKNGSTRSPFVTLAARAGE